MPSIRIPFILPSTIRSFLADPQRLPPSALSSFRRLGLLPFRGLRLTSFGSRLRRLSLDSPSLVPDCLHLYLYTLSYYDRYAFHSWAYSYFVDRLWDSSTLTLNPSFSYVLILDFIGEFSSFYSIPVANVSISVDSVRSVFSWLRALDPPAIRRSSFSRRHFCYPPVFLWALSLLYSHLRHSHGVRMFLSEDRLLWLCRACLIEPDSIHDILHLTRRYSDYSRGGCFDFGFEGGRGLWVYLRSPIDLGDLPS